MLHKIRWDQPPRFQHLTTTYSGFRVDGTTPTRLLDGGTSKPPFGDCAIYSEPAVTGTARSSSDLLSKEEVVSFVPVARYFARHAGNM